MKEEIIVEENFLWEETAWGGIEAIQDKTSFHLSKLFAYFDEEDQKTDL